MEVLSIVISKLSDALILIYCIILLLIGFYKVDYKNWAKIRLHIAVVLVLFEGFCVMMWNGSWISFILSGWILVMNLVEVKNLK